MLGILEQTHAAHAEQNMSKAEVTKWSSGALSTKWMWMYKFDVKK